jgi:glycosyltransferase involved in cell wall biosynthesis
MPTTLFLYLKSFSFTGGIEKFNRCFLKALHEVGVEKGIHVKAISSHDTVSNEQYFPTQQFKGFGGNRILFILYACWQALFAKQIILGHINLAVIGCWVKWLRPKTELIVIIHGVDVWQPQTGFKLKALQMADKILSVSNYTKTIVCTNHPEVNPNKIHIFPNTIDPYFKLPSSFQKPQYLQERYGLKEATKVLLTVTRLANTEQFKGYDHTISVLPILQQQLSANVQYILGGKGQEQELARIEQHIQQTGTKHQVQLIGFIKDEELIDHYLLADVFVMPSKKEGFGIVFIEAMACGLKVIAGNKDGSVDALLNGELGTLIDPDNKVELLQALQSALLNQIHDGKALQEIVVTVFGFNTYKERLQKYLSI